MRRLYLTVLFLCNLLLISACGTDNGFTAVPIPTASIIIVNTIPDAPELVAITDKNQTLAQVDFAQASAPAAVLPQIAVGYTIQYLDNETTVTLTQATTTIDINAIETVVLTGSIAAPDSIIISTPEATFAADTTDTELQLLNVASNIDSVNFILTNPLADTQTITLLNGIPSDKITTTAGDGLNIEIRDAVTDNLLWSSGEFSLGAATQRVLILADYFGPGTETVRMFSATNQLTGNLFPNEQLPSVIRFANMTPDRGPLDFVVDGETIVAAQSFGDITEYLDVNSGELEVILSDSLDNTDIISTTSVNILPGNFYTIGASGLTDIVNNISITTDQQRRIPARASLTLTNLSPESPLVDVYLSNAGSGIVGIAPVLTNLAIFVGAAVNLPTRSYDLTVTQAATANIIFGPQQIDIDTNRIYSAILRDTAGGGEPTQITLADDFNQ